MKSNIKIIIITGIMLIFGFLGIQKTEAQINFSDNMDENRLVYWFYVGVREVEDNKTGYVSYDLQRKGNKIDHGTEKQYKRILWKYLGNGTKMALGPFNDYRDAKKAYYLYDTKTDSLELDSTYNMDQQVYWFILHVNRRPRSNSYELVRKPGAVASGNYRDFELFLKENLMMRVMTVGPFTYMPEAEESKRQYRLIQ